MSVCLVVQSSGIVATGSGVTPGAINWTNINTTGAAPVVIGTTNTQTVTTIDTPITLHAAWTTAGDGNTGGWIKNGVAQSTGISPRDVSVNVNDTLAFRILLPATDAAATAGLVTVTNTTDGGAAIDTFSYYVEHI